VILKKSSKECGGGCRAPATACQQGMSSRLVDLDRCTTVATLRFEERKGNSQVLPTHPTKGATHLRVQLAGCVWYRAITRRPARRRWRRRRAAACGCLRLPAAGAAGATGAAAIVAAAAAPAAHRGCPVWSAQRRRLKLGELAQERAGPEAAVELCATRLGRSTLAAVRADAQNTVALRWVGQPVGALCW
jgi:hypothetical protein